MSIELNSAFDQLNYMAVRWYKDGGYDKLTVEEIEHEERMIQSFMDAWEIIINHKQTHRIPQSIVPMLGGLNKALIRIDSELKRRGIREKVESDFDWDDLL